MRRLRIQLVVPWFAVERDDAGFGAILDLVERIASRHEVEVLALRYPRRRRRYLLAGAAVESLGLGGAGGAGGRARVLGAGGAAVLRTHRRRPLDLVHALWADEPGAVAVLASRLIRRPSIVSIMGGELVALPEIGYGAGMGRGGRWTVHAALRAADLVTAGSEFVRRQAAGLRMPARISLLPLGVDTAAFKPSSGAPKAPTVLFVGSLEPVKDPALVLRVFRDLTERHPTARLVLAGEGSLRPSLEEFVSRHGLRDAVSFAGYVPRARMPGLYRSASVLCVTSRHESQSVAAVEAAASGLPIAGTAVGIVPELGDGALAVPIGDGTALLDGLDRVLGDSALARRMGRAARAAAVERFDIERTSSELLGLYERVTAR